jgi:hypothetical protein
MTFGQIGHFKTNHFGDFSPCARGILTDEKQKPVQISSWQFAPIKLLLNSFSVRLAFTPINHWLAILLTQFEFAFDLSIKTGISRKVNAATI